jgi:hypothetical protein
MAQGPILIFDKSTLQALNPDEAHWLDNFFLSNITPLFYIETLADLEKEVRQGKTPEQVVGEIAYKSPDMQAYPNVHHLTLICEFGNLAWPTSAVCFGPPLGTLMLRGLGSAGA